jgi:hypothetical protein
MVQWPSRKTLFSPRPFARANPEPMDTEGVSVGDRFALAGSVVARRLEASRSIHNGALRRKGQILRDRPFTTMAR